MVVGCSSLDECLEFYADRMGFVVDAIFPADNPTVAVISTFGLRLRLDSTLPPTPVQLNLYCDKGTLSQHGDSPIAAPGGTVVHLLAATPLLSIPPLVEARHVIHMDGRQTWVTGRAGMQYRDLLPSRLGGRFVASHIRIPDGGPVPDYVHYHRVRFQVIFCVKGWVRVVYEDQGEPFLLQEGDCVLQPPEIRHRVLECSPGLEVVEVGCPAEHETIADHHMLLPTACVQSDRRFGGQRFSRHIASDAVWSESSRQAFDLQTSGIYEATDGLANLTVWKRNDSGCDKDYEQSLTHYNEFRISFVLGGTASLQSSDKGERLLPGSAFCFPAGQRHHVSSCSDDFSWLEIELPRTHAK